MSELTPKNYFSSGGMQVIVDESVPPDEIHLVDYKGAVHRIVNIGHEKEGEATS